MTTLNIESRWALFVRPAIESCTPPNHDYVAISPMYGVIGGRVLAEPAGKLFWEVNDDLLFDCGLQHELRRRAAGFDVPDYFQQSNDAQEYRLWKEMNGK